MNATPDTCVIADDHPLMREILRMRLETAGFEVVGQAGDGTEAVRLIGELEPTVALIDLNMPGLNGIEVISQVAQLQTRTKSIIYAASARQQDVERALNAGASGYLDKGADSDLLTTALHTVLSGGRFVDPTVAGAMFGHAAAPISPREHEVLELVAEGLQNKEIGAKLGLSTETVKAHVTSLMTKLDVHNRTGAVALALREGLIS